MKCSCGGKTKVMDSRLADNERTMRRRRDCEKCGARFTTTETFLAQDARVFNNPPAPQYRIVPEAKREDNLSPEKEISDDDKRRNARRKIEEIRERRNAGLD